MDLKECHTTSSGHIFEIRRNDSFESNGLLYVRNVHHAMERKKEKKERFPKIQIQNPDPKSRSEPPFTQNHHNLN